MASKLSPRLTALALLTTAAWLLATAAWAQGPGGDPADAAKPDDDPYGPPTEQSGTATTAASGTSTAPANEPLAICVGAFKAAQQLRRSGQLLASRKQLTLCGQPHCPSILTDKCTRWHREVTAALPSIVVAAKDPEGRDAIHVRVRVDARTLATSLHGRSLELDPGPHALQFDLPGAVSIQRTIVLTEGEKRRRVAIRFAKADRRRPRSPEPPGASSSDGPASGPIWPLVVGGFAVGGAGLVVGTVTGAIALDERASLADSCPNDLCPDDLRDDYRRARTLANVSTLSFIAATVGATVGVVSLFVTTTPDRPKAGSQGPIALRPAVGFGSASLTVTLP